MEYFDDEFVDIEGLNDEALDALVGGTLSALVTICPGF